MKVLSLVCAVLLLASAGCEENVVVGKPPPSASAGAPPAPASASAAALPELDVEDADFAESEDSRDPFRSFAKLFVDESGQVEVQLDVKLKQYSLEQLQLVGIITRVHPARAMLVDPTGKGHVIKRGQFVGKPVVVQTAKDVGASYKVHWRVDSIRPNDVVFVREDPTNPDVPAQTRTLVLRQEDEQGLRLENAG